MMEYNEDDFLLLSGIQHFAFCRRQWALIHIEQQWQENLRTVEGGILHERAHDDGFSEKRGDVIISRGMSVFSRTMGVSGVCDIVELHKCANGVNIFGREGLYLPIPVEYKRGKPKENDSDILQLCGQAMCLEEMLLCEIKEAYMFYGETKHRLKITLDNDLREKVKSMLFEMHELYNRRYTPKVKPSLSCKACSLSEICMPKLCKNPSVARYIKDNLEEAGE
ncbi:MAG TPA: CRISPR-associated protein Cas4 [Ruminiclostridium sp.]